MKEVHPSSEGAQLRAEARRLAGELGTAIGQLPDDLERAIYLQNDSYRPDNRNLIAVLASTAQLVALANDLKNSGEDRWWNNVGADGRSTVQRLKAGEIDAVRQELVNKRAGRFDVTWDQQWPAGVARRRIREALPSTAHVGDVLIGADGGARVKLRVVRETDGGLTAEPIAGTWVDPPREDVAAETYRRLAARFPSALPEVDN